MEFDVIVEIPRGQRNKYEYDHETGRISLDRTLFTSMVYPADYGFIEGTLAEDGDPLDVLVLLDEPTLPGCLVRSRAIALFEMTDEQGPDSKVIAVPSRDPRYADARELDNLTEFQRDSIQHFFEEYKSLEAGKHVTGALWRGREEAEAEIDRARQRLGGHD